MNFNLETGLLSLSIFTWAVTHMGSFEDDTLSYSITSIPYENDLIVLPEVGTKFDPFEPTNLSNFPPHGQSFNNGQFEGLLPPGSPEVSRLIFRMNVDGKRGCSNNQNLFSLIFSSNNICPQKVQRREFFSKLKNNNNETLTSIRAMQLVVISCRSHYMCFKQSNSSSVINSQKVNSIFIGEKWFLHS